MSRPTLSQLGSECFDAIERLLKAKILSDAEPTGGFTDGYASVVTTVEGNRFFVKAAPASRRYAYGAYCKEREVNLLLPAGAPAPRMLFSEVDQNYVVLVFNAVEPMWLKPFYTPARLEALDSQLKGLHSALDRVPVEHGRDAASLVNMFEYWETLNSDLEEGLVGLESELSYLLESNVLFELVKNEQAFRQVLESPCFELSHWDVRSDNVLFDGYRYVFVDFAQVSKIPQWVDYVLLHLDAARSGVFDIPLLLTHGDYGHIRAAVAALTGYYLAGYRVNNTSALGVFCEEMFGAGMTLYSALSLYEVK